MTKPLSRGFAAVGNRLPPDSLRDVGALLICLAAVLLAWIMHQGLFVVERQSGIGLYTLPPDVGLGVFVVLFAVLSLLAYRMRPGVYTGFQHSAIIAAYLTLGPAPTVAVGLIGTILAEIGRYFFGKWLDLRRHTVGEALRTILFSAGAHGTSALLAGLLYALLGGPLPLIVLEGWSRLVVPLGILLAANLFLYNLFIAIATGWIGRSTDTENLKEAIPQLVAGEIFSLPLTLLLPVAYYELPPIAFLLLVGGTVLAALLFRLSERARWGLERRVNELGTLNSIGQSMASSLAMNDLMRSIYDQVAKLMDTPFFYIALYTADTQTLSFPFAVRNGERITLEPYQSMNGVIEHIIRTGEPLLLRGSVVEQLTRLGLHPTAIDNSACYLGVPLSVDDEVMGVLAIQHHTRSDAYSASDVAVLSAVAAQAAVALHNASLYNRVWEMADELTLLNNVSSVVTATLDLDIVLDTTCAVVIQIGHADKTGIFLTSEDGQTVRLVHSIGLSDDFVAQFQNIRRDDDSGPTQILRQNSAMAIPDVWTDPRGLGWRSLAEVEGYVGLLAVPLIASDEVIGFLAAFYEQPHLFGKSELDLMNTLANQVAVTVANARLFQDAQARAQEMSRLVEASRAFTASLDLKSVADTVLDELVGVLLPDMIALMLFDQQANLLRPLSVRGLETMETMAPKGSVVDAITTCKALTLPDNSDDLDVLRSLGLSSLYVIPLVSQEKVIGVVLVGHETVRIFTLRERQLAEALVNQAATAVRNAQLYSQTDAALSDRVSELSAIEAISRKISGALDLEAIINDVLDTALTVTQADEAGCALVTDPDFLSFAVRYSPSSDLTPIKGVVRRDTGIIGRVLRTGVIARIGNVQADPDYVRGELSDMRSELCVPIAHKDERGGVLNVESRRPNAFTAFHERFLVNLADHAAIAIENARLFEERQIQIDTLIKFRDLSLALLSATSLRAVMSLIAEYALVITHAKDVHLYLYDQANDTLTFGASLWLDGRQNVEASRPERGGSTWQVAHSGKMQIIEDTSQLQPAVQFNHGPGFGAIARIPLKRGDQALGVLNIAFREPHYFTETESRALDLLANQAAIAIENARLFEEVRTGRDRMQVILNSTSDGMLLLGTNSELILANPAAERLLNQPLKVLTGKNALRLIARAHREVGDQQAVASIIDAIRRMLHDIRQAPNQITRHTFQVQNSDEVRDIEGVVLPVRDNAGNIGGRLVVLRDVSEEKSVERFRWEATNMIVHDLRAPLGAVISSLRLVQEMVETGDFTDLDQVVSIALNSSEHQLQMIESILEIAKLETGRIPLNIQVWPLHPLVSKAISAIDLLATASNIRVIDCVPANLPPLQIDEEQIRRVLINLLDNALRHTPAEGQVRVEASALNGKGIAQIGVIDTGPGIPTDARERIFEKFYQVSQSKVRGHRGVGLGLTFCKLSIEAHGGRIWVEDGPEGGAAFWFTLPLAENGEA